MEFMRVQYVQYNCAVHLFSSFYHLPFAVFYLPIPQLQYAISPKLQVRPPAHGLSRLETRKILNIRKTAHLHSSPSVTSRVNYFSNQYMNYTQNQLSSDGRAATRSDYSGLNFLSLAHISHEIVYSISVLLQYIEVCN